MKVRDEKLVDMCVEDQGFSSFGQNDESCLEGLRHRRLDDIH